MDLIIKNLERLKDYSNGNRRPIEKVVIDFDKLATEDFAQIFFDACEDIKMSDLCVKCKNYHNGEKTVNCKSYITPEFSCYEEKPKEPTLEEATERMQSEFDATGIDVKVFMNGRVINR